jgi:hypothetical protein
MYRQKDIRLGVELLKNSPFDIIAIGLYIRRRQLSQGRFAKVGDLVTSSSSPAQSNRDIPVAVNYVVILS